MIPSLARLEQLAEQASKGPWYFDGRDIFSVEIGGDGHRLVIPLPETWHESQGVNKADADLVVGMRNALPALIQIARKAQHVAEFLPIDPGEYRDSVLALQAALVGMERP